jgi:hypothetical protein
MIIFRAKDFLRRNLRREQSGETSRPYAGARPSVV